MRQKFEELHSHFLDTILTEQTDRWQNQHQHLSDETCKRLRQAITQGINNFRRFYTAEKDGCGCYNCAHKKNLWIDCISKYSQHLYGPINKKARALSISTFTCDMEEIQVLWDNTIGKIIEDKDNGK